MPPLDRNRFVGDPALAATFDKLFDLARQIKMPGEACEALLGLGFTFEVLVVDDGSTDQTAQLVEEFVHFWPEVRLVRHSENRGYGAALRSGFEAARFDLIAFTDADCQFHLEDLDDLVAATDRNAIAVGVRSYRQDPLLRIFLSWGYNKLTRFLLGTGVTDLDCALKVFRREALQELLPTSKGFFVNAEMLCRARQFGWRIAESCVRHRARRRGKSKVSLREVPRTFKTLFLFWWQHVVRHPATKRPLAEPNEPKLLPFPSREYLAQPKRAA